MKTYETYTNGYFRTMHGFWLRDIRTRIYGMSQADFAKHVLHTSTSSVSQMELGKIGPTARAKELLDMYKDNVVTN